MIVCEKKEKEGYGTINYFKEHQKKLRLRNMARYAKESYELELRREEQLYNQSGRVLTAISIFFVALLSDVSKWRNANSNDPLLAHYFWVISLLLLLSSLFFLLLAQWRYSYKALKIGSGLNQEVEERIVEYREQKDYDYLFYDQYSNIHKSLREINDRRTRLLLFSMILFLLAMASFIGFILN